MYMIMSFIIYLFGDRMFEWFKRRKRRDEEFFLNYVRAAAEGENRAKVNRALGSVGVQLPFEPDNTQYCIKASAALVRVVTEKVGVSMHAADKDDRFVVGIFGFVAGDYFSGIMGAPFETVSSIVALDLLGVEYAAQIGSLGDSYNRMAQTGRVIEAIGQNIAKWVSAPTDEQLKKLADLFKLCRQHA